MVATFFVSVIVGLGIGVFSALLGIGGGTIMVPMFRLGFGMSALSATATSLFTIIPTSISGALSHIRNNTCHPKIGIALGLGGACMSPIGVWLAQITPSWSVMGATAIAIGYSAITMLRKAVKAPKPGNSAIRADGSSDSATDADDSLKPAELPASDITSQDAPPTNLTPAGYARAVGIGAIAGLASGYVGLGGGFLMVPMMLSLLHMSMKQASGTSLIAIMILALPATIMQCVIGNVNYLAGIAVACGSIPGAVIGSKLTAYVPERSLRFLFAGFLGLAAVSLVLKELGLLG